MSNVYPNFRHDITDFRHDREDMGHAVLDIIHHEQSRLYSLFTLPAKYLRQRTVRVDKHLCVSVDPAVELVVRIRCLVNRDVVADDEAGLRLASNDHVTKVSVVRLDVALTSTQGKTLRRLVLETAA